MPKIRLSPETRQEVESLVRTTKRSAQLLNTDLTDYRTRHPLEDNPFTESDVTAMWNDVKMSTGFLEHISGRRFKEWLGGDRADISDTYLRDHYEEFASLFPMDISSRLIKWYSVFKPAYLDYQIKGVPAYVPNHRDYKDFFALRRNGNLPPDVLFYYLIHKLYTLEARTKRREVIRMLLSDPGTVEQLENHVYITPANLQFFLTTPQVYNAFYKAKIDGKTLPFQKAVKVSKDQKKRFALIESLMREEGISMEEAFYQAKSSLAV